MVVEAELLVILASGAVIVSSLFLASNGYASNALESKERVQWLIGKSPERYYNKYDNSKQ